MRVPLASVVLLLLAAFCLQGASRAATLYKQGREAERQGNIVQAYLLYAEAAALDPKEKKYWLRAEVLRTQAGMKAAVRPQFDASSAAPPLPPDSGIPPDVDLIALPPEPQPPIELAGASGLRSFDERGNAKELWENVASRYGLKPVFDTDFRAEQPLRLTLEDVDFRMALRALEAATNSFVVAISKDVFLVVEDNPARRRDVEPTATVVIPLPDPVSMEDVNAVAQAVRGALDSTKLFLEPQRRLLVLRDRVSKIPPAQAIIEQLLTARPEVEIEIELIEVSKRRAASYGFSMQTNFPIVYAGGAIFNSEPVYPKGYDYFGFGRGKSKFAAGITGVRVYATLTDSDGQNLMRAMIRSVQGQAANFHAGVRYPVITGGYFGPYEDIPGQTYRPPPSFQFEDLGLVLKVTPFVHGADEVTLTIETEFKLLTGQSFNDIPVIANRKFSSTIRMGMNQWALVGGILSTREGRSLSGLAGLSQIPALGALFRENNREEDENQLLLALRPRLLRPSPSTGDFSPIRVGSETRPLTPF